MYTNLHSIVTPPKAPPPSPLEKPKPKVKDKKEKNNLFC